VDFWNVFWLMLIYIPLLLLWGFALFDIFRRDDISGWGKGLWLLAVLILPFVGSLLYVLFRPRGATAAERRVIENERRMAEHAGNGYAVPVAPMSRVEELQVLSDLHDRGKLDDAEYQAEKARILASSPISAAAASSSPPPSAATATGGVSPGVTTVG
jgi:hypothetical protein